MHKMKIEGCTEDGREQRDLLTVVRCMLCLIPESIITLREELEDVAVKMSFPTNDQLVYLNKEISLILYDYYEKYKKYTWMKLVFAIYLNKNISEVLGSYGEKSESSVDLDFVKVLCDNGVLKASIELEDESNHVYIKLRDTNKDKAVVLETLKLRDKVSE